MRKPRVQKRIAYLSFTLALILCLPSCATMTNQQYYWGNYEAMLYQQFKDSNGIDFSEHVRAFEDLVIKAENDERPVAPGIYAHLGYLYSLQGQLDLAKQALIKEKLLFPEATTYIDGLLANIDKLDKAEYEPF